MHRLREFSKLSNGSTGGVRESLSSSPQDRSSCSGESYLLGSKSEDMLTGRTNARPDDDEEEEDVSHRPGKRQRRL